MEELTIIIPSKNRPELLRRSCIYWSKREFKVIICDGSDESQEKWVGDLFSPNIIYIHSQNAFPQRIKIAADVVDTRYCMLLSDDEFYLPKALIECIRFLDNNDEYIAVGGVAVGFRPGKTGILGFEQYPEWIGRERIESSPGDRVVAHMSSYANYLSASVTKSEFIKSIASLYASRELPIFALLEFEMNLILSYCGKSKVLSNLMHFRSHGECVPIRNNIPSLSTKNSICDLWRSDNCAHIDLKKDFVSIVSSAVADFSISESSPGSEVIAIEAAIYSYCEWIKHKGGRNRFIGLLKKVIPVSIRDRLTFLAAMKRRLGGGLKPLEEAIKDLELSGISFDANDVTQVISSIKDFYGYR